MILHKLDSVHQTNSIARHFAGLYLETTQNAVDFFYTADEPARHFIQRLEVRFADYFFQSALAWQQKDTISSNWKIYYADTTLSSLQYSLLGANAHINGDIWKALTTEFSLEELREYKRYYFNYQKGLKKIYHSLYANAIDSSATVRLLHKITLGSDNWYGQIMLARWRKRQMNLAILYFTNRERFNKKLRKLHHKMTCINNLILHDL
jgi:hypothetical protein